MASDSLNEEKTEIEIQTLETLESLETMSTSLIRANADAEEAKKTAEIYKEEVIQLK